VRKHNESLQSDPVNVESFHTVELLEVSRTLIYFWVSVGMFWVGKFVEEKFLSSGYQFSELFKLSECRSFDH
jgi:hypothetical protein